MIGLSTPINRFQWYRSLRVGLASPTSAVMLPVSAPLSCAFLMYSQVRPAKMTASAAIQARRCIGGAYRRRPNDIPTATPGTSASVAARLYQAPTRPRIDRATHPHRPASLRAVVTRESAAIAPHHMTRNRGSVMIVVALLKTHQLTAA